MGIPEWVVETAATSVGGRPLSYAIVGTPARLATLPTIQGHRPRCATRRRAARRRRGPQRHPGDPVGLGQRPRQRGERRGRLAPRPVRAGRARATASSTDILADAIVVILPIPEPGRPRGGDSAQPLRLRHEPRLVRPDAAGDRRQARGHPRLPADALHRRPRVRPRDYFFPPNADPEYHEIPDTAHDWINELYSPAIAGEFDRQGIKYFHGAPYDFFAMIFGDTVPTAGFHAAGMTFEKENGDPIAEREHEQFTSIWASPLRGGRVARRDHRRPGDDSFVEA